ncbi:class I SAM-dependent methyltransferase family protein [Candidatus Woesearchaeota archaeon]|nr:class I SAM-dependent methyltransferase family protein [Candidatus Woesearchaeota archaeon]
MKLKELLKDKLSVAELDLMPTSFDVVGDILIFADFPTELVSKQQVIGEAIIAKRKNVNVILKKTGEYSGELRTPVLEVIAGENRKETIHKENNVRLKLDVEKVYFSARSANERLRISELVQDGESVLVMFSGCAPFVCVIAKNAAPSKVIGVELNKVGHEYGLTNVKMNKLENVELINGDVKEIVPKLGEKFDRVLMPLPKSAEDFLDVALTAVKKGSMVHFYDFLQEKEFDQAREKVLSACKRNNIKCEIVDVVKCGQYAPYTFRISVDFKIV